MSITNNTRIITKNTIRNLPQRPEIFVVATLPSGLLTLAAVQTLYSGDAGYVGVTEYPFNSNGSVFIVTFDTGTNAKAASGLGIDGAQRFTNDNIASTDCLFIVRHLQHTGSEVDNGCCIQ